VVERNKGVDPDCLRGLRALVDAAIEYGLAVAEGDDERAFSIPASLLAQTRRAAGNGVSLDTIFRYCLAAHALLSETLLKEAERSGLPGRLLRDLVSRQAIRFDQLLGALGEEFAREQKRRFYSSDARIADRVRRLLAGQLLDTSSLSYDLDLHHLGGVAEGAEAAEAIRRFAKALESRLLLIKPSDEVVWAWFGIHPSVDSEQLDRALALVWPPHLPLALGEIGSGYEGWRLTHEQAKAALPIAVSKPGLPVQYADVALLASIIRDNLLATSLREIFLVPLQGARGGGAALLETLRAYFATGRNGASTAAALGVSRQTVSNRLRAIEGHLGRPLAGCTGELEAALRLEQLEPVVKFDSQDTHP
jgi:hypothetical protein